tara:strand:+ start:1465 stop:1710 length:246 start_codon:yes stop_codon:yes gene_type:complete
MTDDKFFIIEKTNWKHRPVQYEIKFGTPFDFETATKKTFALNTINEDDMVTYHIQKVVLVDTKLDFEESKKFDSLQKELSL